MLNLASVEGTSGFALCSTAVLLLSFKCVDIDIL